jgi:hypothetical protein
VQWTSSGHATVRPHWRARRHGGNVTGPARNVKYRRSKAASVAG